MAGRVGMDCQQKIEGATFSSLCSNPNGIYVNHYLEQTNFIEIMLENSEINLGEFHFIISQTKFRSALDVKCVIVKKVLINVE